MPMFTTFLTIARNGRTGDRADLVGEPRHPSQHLVDVGDYVLAVDLDHGVRGARSAT